MKIAPPVRRLIAYAERQVASAAKVALAVLIGGALVAGPCVPVANRADRRMRVPPVVLWAWERRADLGFINPHRTAVAYLDRTLDLSGNTVVVRPRFQPLTVPIGTELIPVTRIEIDRRSPPSLSVAQRRKAARIIVQTAASSPPEIQIDFDATRSERAFYRQLLASVRGSLPPSTALSITALASWCMDDDWVSGLPVDEIVPMLYRMGPDATQIISYVRGGGRFPPALARLSVGLSTDEQIAGLGVGKRLYLFSPHPWTAKEVRKAVEEATR